MRALILSLVALTLLAGLVFLIGAQLPATREGRAATTIAAPPERVLAVIADVEAQPEWRDVRSVIRTPEGWVEVTPRGERIAFIVQEMSVAQIHLRFSSEAGYAGEWHAVLEPAGGGTRIAVIERATVPSPLGRIVARLVFNPEAFAMGYLAALKARVER